MERSECHKIIKVNSTGCVLTTSEECIRLLGPANVMWSNKASWPVAKDRSAVVTSRWYISVMDMKSGITFFIFSAEVRVKWGHSSGPEGGEF